MVMLGFLGQASQLTGYCQSPAYPVKICIYICPEQCEGWEGYAVGQAVATQ